MKKIRKKRKALIENILLLLSFILCVSLCLIVFLNKTKSVAFADVYNDELDYERVSTLDLDLYSDKYMLIRLDDMKVLYGKNINEQFYPASLAKVVTMDALLHNVDNIEETSFYSNEQYNTLIADNASIAGLKTNTDYKLEELLYALILPSGADAAVALENYCRANNINLIDEMNKLKDELLLENSNFTNTTGLHDDLLYTTMSDYAKIIIDTIKFDIGKSVLKSLLYEGVDESYTSSLSTLGNCVYAKVLGGKTGFTYEAGLNLCVLYRQNNRSYLLLLANATGEYREHNNIKDALKIFEYLYRG